TGTSTNLFNGNLEGETQDFKIPHLRNMYEKVGFDVIRPGLTSGNANNIGLPTQKKGFGFIHDGALSLTEFLAANVFTSTTQQERDLFAFMLAFPTESVPAIGRQVTVTAANKNDSTVASTIATLVGQAETPNADLTAKGAGGGGCPPLPRGAARGGGAARHRPRPRHLPRPHRGRSRDGPGESEQQSLAVATVKHARILTLAAGGVLVIAGGAWLWRMSHRLPLARTRALPPQPLEVA